MLVLSIRGYPPHPWMGCCDELANTMLRAAGRHQSAPSLTMEPPEARFQGAAYYIPLPLGARDHAGERSRICRMS